ncbi:hypothetical protein F5Y17DRAFT_465545 [Xylariaceae sp. FL0594]|nr:hypothetical protein F5Y17DRAFT_465545 [Xylariaceae sp. FL0594]
MGQWPEPPAPLTGGCTVIFNNTLYAYTGSAFQSLKLEEGAEWKKLPGGQLVEGGVCVGSTPKDVSTAGVFIVGGKSSDAEYPGLQKFTYSTGRWETIVPEATVTKDRVYHSATYLNSTESLLVYAGSADDSPVFSQQTFTIGTSEPYGVLAYQSDITPPGIAPLLLPWSETQAVLIGGNPWNTKVLLFDTTAYQNGVVGAWVDSGITLAEPLGKNTTLIKATVIQGTDQSRHLYTFDLSTSPNTVNRTVLITAGGRPVTFAAPVRPHGKNEKEIDAAVSIAEQDLLESDWPRYNSTFAPKSTRRDYSIATDQNGLVVLSGGNDADALCMFNARANAWKDTEAVFGGARTFSTQSTPTSASSSTAMTSPTTTFTSTEAGAETTVPTSTTGPTGALPAVPDGTTTAKASGLPPTTILGITLGSLFGSAIILAIVLLLLRRRQRKQNFVEIGHARRASGIPDNNEFFRDDIAEASGGRFRGHMQQDSQNSLSSMAIFLGKPQKSAMQRKGSGEKTRESHGGVYNRDWKSSISRPQARLATTQSAFNGEEKAVSPPEPAQPKPRARPNANRESEMRRSSGWNRYWSGGSASILGFGGKSQRDTQVSEDSSRYSDVNRLTQDSATVLPLQVNVEGRPSFHCVNSGSPTVSQYDPKISQGQSGKIVERPVSAVSAVSTASVVSYVSSAGYSSGIPPSVHEAWDPMPQRPWGSERAPSSAYSNSGASESLYQTALGVPGANRPRVGMSSQPPLAVASISTDMSWLNLGDNDGPGPTGPTNNKFGP